MTQPELGICQWFHYEDHRAVERAVELMHELGVRHLRTGISWADYHRPGGPRWYDWQMRQLAEFDVLVSVWHTPPSIARHGCCNSPPVRLEEYGEFIEEIIDRHGEYFSHLELWNEPNNRYKWDFHLYDPDWSRFGEMIRLAAPRARRRGIPTVLGGMIPVDHEWLALMKRYGALNDIDIVGIHGFPEMWWPDGPCWDRPQHWRGWDEKVGYIEQHTEGRPVWVTETGLATWDVERQREARFDLQVRRLQAAARAPVPRLYWYSLIDLHPDREAIEGFHVDENEYHLGLVTCDGFRKDAFHRMQELLKEPAEAGRS